MSGSSVERAGTTRVGHVRLITDVRPAIARNVSSTTLAVPRFRVIFANSRPFDLALFRVARSIIDRSIAEARDGQVAQQVVEART